MEAYVANVTRNDGRELFLFVSCGQMLGHAVPRGKDVFAVGCIEGQAHVEQRQGESAATYAERAIEGHSHTFLEPEPTMRLAIQAAERYAAAWKRGTGPAADACPCGPIDTPKATLRALTPAEMMSRPRRLPPPPPALVAAPGLITLTQDAFLKLWGVQCDEWAAIRDEMIASGRPPTAFQVSLEQRKRMLARGERPVSLAEVAT